MARTLFLIGATGCPFCAEAKKHLERFEASHPEVRTRALIIDEVDWPEEVLASPDAVPAYAVIEPGARPRTIVGRVLTVADLEAWVPALATRSA